MSKPTATRLDWLSFTVQVLPEDVRDDSVRTAKDIAHRISQSFGGALSIEYPNIGQGRFPYKFSSSGDGFKAFWTPQSTEVLIEIEGYGCERLEAAGLMKQVVGLALESLTRVDIATDIETETDPRDFVAVRSNQRHKSHETSVSSTGITCYIGSRHSDRFARVYRYAAPHPRADRLRVEMVYRGPQAVALARTWLEEGNEETAARAGNQYGWQHDDWTPHSEEKIDAWRPDRKTHKKVLWFHSQIKPAVRRMLAEGLLTREELIEALLGPSEGQERPN